MLDTTGLMPSKLQLSTNGVLAVSGDRNYVDSFSPDVKVSVQLAEMCFQCICILCLNNISYFNY